MATLHTISTPPWITRDALASLLQQRTPPPSLAIIDVRDDDHVGGHIRGSKHVPVPTHDFRMPELVRSLRDVDTVVFHCALSQQRGPASALRYLRERDRLGGTRSDGKDVKEAQMVAVLEGGFVRWQEKYGENKELTEAYDKEIWSNE